MVHAKVDDSSDAEFSYGKVGDSPYDSSDRASQLKGVMELEIHDRVSASAH